MAIRYINLYLNWFIQNAIACTTKNSKKLQKTYLKRINFHPSFCHFLQISNDCCNLIKRRTMKVICEHANFFKKFSTWYGIHNLYKQHTSRGRISLAATRNRPTSEFCWTFSGQQEIFLDILLFTHFSLCFKQWLFCEKTM